MSNNIAPRNANKVVGPESAPMVTAALVVSALQDSWQLYQWANRGDCFSALIQFFES